jgi:DNA invertase Pin-like site-specific DNA recombinase
MDRKRRCKAGEAEESDLQERARKKAQTKEPRTEMTKRAVIYCRVSTGDQHIETQLLDLRAIAKQRGLEIVREYSDVISGAKSKRPGLDQLMTDARRHRFDVVLVAAFDRIARNVRHFLDVLDELNHLNIQFISLRENIDTGGPLGRAMLTIIGAISELERSLIVERVKAGMRRAKLEGRRIGRTPLDTTENRSLKTGGLGCLLRRLQKSTGFHAHRFADS